jgi:Tfp pilus assembly protein PilF
VKFRFMRSNRLFILLVLLPASFNGCQSHNSVAPPSQNTNLARVQNEAAFKLIKEGKYNEAEDILNNAIAADVMYGPARNNRGLVYLKQGKLYPAAWEFENAIKLMPHQPEVRNNLGLVLEEGGKLNEATDSFARAHELEPDNPEYIANLAHIRVERRLLDDDTRKLLKELVFKETRPDRLRWAREQLIRMPPPGQDIVTIPATQPSAR